MLSVVDDVSVDSVTSVITLLILKICRLNHRNRIYVRAFIELSVRTIRVFELYHIIKKSTLFLFFIFLPMHHRWSVVP